MRVGFNKTARNTLISVLVMVILFVLAGVGYVLVSDRHPTPNQAQTVSNANKQTPAPIKPKAPSPSAPEGVALQSLISPVAAGQNTTLEAITNAGSTCTIKAVYNNVASRDSGLVAKTADAYGLVSWTWTVNRSAPPGTWPVTVTCVYHGRSGVLVGNLQVTR